MTEPASLLLGLRDQRGTLRFLSQTYPLPVRARRDLGGHLTPMTFQGDATGHPWPVPLPAAWSLNLTDRQPLHYVQVEPRLVVEVEVDTARDGPLGKFRHRSTMLRLRADLTTADTDILT